MIRYIWYKYGYCINIVGVFKFLYSYMFDLRIGGRDDVSYVVIIIIDGRL